MPFSGTVSTKLMANRFLTGEVNFSGYTRPFNGQVILNGILSFTGDLIADKVGGFLKQVLLKAVNLKQVLLEKINFSE